MILKANLAITPRCEEDACPVVPNELRDWQLEDPHGEPIETVRKIRDEIQLKVRTLIRELDDTPIK
jgi:protein-tyrosine-phosphatase